MVCVGCGTVELAKLPTMYRLMHSYLAEAGIDGVKVDAQSGIGMFAYTSIYKHILAYTHTHTHKDSLLKTILTI